MKSQGDWDVIIIGAGVVGSSIALALARQGYRTLNVDQLPAAGYGSTSHSSAIIRPFYSHVTSAAIAHEARHHWQHWPQFLGTEDERGFAVYQETGGMVLVREGEEAQFEQNLEVLRAVGIEHRILTAEEILARHPGISLEAYGPPRRPGDPGFGQPVNGRIASGIVIPASGYVTDPQLAAHNLANAAIQNGADFRYNLRVVRINRQQDQSISGVATESGESFSAPILVNAAGPHSSRINKLAGLEDSRGLNTSAQRHEVAYARAPAGYLNQPEFIVDLDSGVYQKPDGVDMLIGSADPACDEPEVVDPDDYNSEFTGQWTTQVMRAAQRWPELGIENSARGTVGLYDVSSDWIPVYDRTDIEGFYVAIGTSGNQFKNAPLIGEIMAAIIKAGDHDRNPAQLTLPSVRMTADLSFYSRLREIQQTSSVMA